MATFSVSERFACKVLGQQRDLTAYADRAGYEVVGIFKETASGARLDRAERKRVIALAQRREIDVVLVTELSRWRSVARSTSCSSPSCRAGAAVRSTCCIRSRISRPAASR